MSVFAKASAKRSARAAWTGLAIVGVSTLLLTACTSGGTPSSTESEKPADSGDAQPVEAGDRDLTLKVGQIAPQSGTLAVLGPPQIAAAQLAVNDINAADLGITVELTLRDEGDSTVDVATGSVTDL